MDSSIVGVVGSVVTPKADNTTIHVSNDGKSVSSNPLPGFNAVTMPTSYVKTYVQALDRVTSVADIKALNRSAGLLSGTYHTGGR
jgi:hypothetical protein